MNLGIMRNSSLHKTLQLLNLSPRSLTEIKRLIEYKQTMDKFQGDIMNVLTNANLIRRKNQQFYITPSGEEELKRLGVVKKYINQIKEKTPSHLYQGLEIAHSVQRPGADDHLKYPSRRGSNLYYRDGRVESV